MMAHLQYMPGDPRLVDQLVYELKSKGIFDQFRKECIADVDTRPAYQNLRQRVESSVSMFLSRQVWKPDLNKNQLREKLRKHILDGNYLEQGVERIVDQVVNPKVASVFIPQVEDIVYDFLGITRKKSVPVAESSNGKAPSEDLLPTDLEAVSPGSVHDDKENQMEIDNLKETKMEVDIDIPKVETKDGDIYKEKKETELSAATDLNTQDSNISIDKTNIPLPTEDIKLESIPPPENSPPDLKIDLDQIELPNEINLEEIPIPKEEKDNHFKPINSDDDSSSDSSLRRNMSPLTPIRNFNNENSCDAQQAFENITIDSKSDEKHEPSSFRFAIDAKTSENSSDVVKKEPDTNLSYQFRSQPNINNFNTPLYEDSSNSNNLRIDYESDVNSKHTDSKFLEPDINSQDSKTVKEQPKSEDKKSSHKSSHRSRESHRHSSSSKDKRSDSKHSSSRDKKDSKYDKKSSKDDKTKSKNEKSTRDRSRERSEKKDSRDSSKHRSSSSHKTSSQKDSKSSHKSSSHHSSKHDDRKPSSSKDKSERSSDKSSKEHRSSRDSKSQRSDKDKKSSSKNKPDDKDREKKEKKDTDDHYSASGRGNNSRRSTDRDSNDGSSSSKSSHNQTNSKSSASKRETKESTSKSGNTTSGNDTTSPSDKEFNVNNNERVHTTEAPNTKVIRVETHLETPKSTPPRLPFVPEVTLKKPKFAANFEEAKRLMKMRKFLDEEQRRMNQEAALLLEFHENVRPSLSQVYSSIPGPELEFACIGNVENNSIKEINAVNNKEEKQNEINEDIGHENSIEETLELMMGNDATYETVEERSSSPEIASLKYFSEEEKLTANNERNEFQKFLKKYIQSCTDFSKIHLVNCNSYEENLIKEASLTFGKYDIVNYHKNGSLKPGKNIIKDVKVDEEIVLPYDRADSYSTNSVSHSPMFSPVKSDYSFDLSSDYDAKLEEMVNKTSRQQIMEIILGGEMPDETDSEMPQIEYCTESSIDFNKAFTVKRKIDEVIGIDNNNEDILNPKMRKFSDSEQITSTTEEVKTLSQEPKVLTKTRSKYLGKARRVGLPRPKRPNLPNSPSSDKSVENYEQNTPVPTPNGKIKENPQRTKAQQRYATSDLYKPKLHYLSRRNNIT